MLNTNTRIAALMAAKAPYLTDGGLETTLIFHDGLDLPCFAAFPLLDSSEGRAILDAYYTRYVAVAQKAGAGFVLDAPTWRASADWGAQLGYDAAKLARINRFAVSRACAQRNLWQSDETPVIVNGVIGPRGDGYVAGAAMRVADATAFHLPQVRALKAGGADMLTAATMTYVEEAIGVALAAKNQGIACVISFTVETDGKLPTGQPLAEAIAALDEATGGSVLYVMINCAHPEHFSETVAGTEAWRYRIGGVRANASRMSHAELDEATELDDGDPVEFGQLHRDLMKALPNLRVIGGCCGTDHRHISHVSGCVHQDRAS